MERILAVLNRAETARSVLVTAGRLRAKLTNSRLEVLHPRPRIDPAFMPTEEVWTDQRNREFNTRRGALEHELQQVFAKWQKDQPQPIEVPFRIVADKVEATMRAEAANFDLVVLGSAGSRHDPDAKQAIETSLFDVTAPVLLVPEAIPASLGRCIAVAWERSQAADEAVAAALPLLLSADQVAILVAEEGHDRASLPPGLPQSLEQRGISTHITRFDLKGREIGTALLDEARAANADLLVMGAFTHSRMMEALFGGATREILAGASLPVLMHH